jgi:hypothetical protein
MIFRKKKADSPPGGPSVPRGRGAPGAGGDNPLARRFRPDPEPATVDLAEPARFHELPAGEGPDTTPLGKESRTADPDALGRVISRDPATGKFYVHPGPEDCPVWLEREAVQAPTELRRGDTIRVGDAEFRLLPSP